MPLHRLTHVQAPSVHRINSADVIFFRPMVSFLRDITLFNCSISSIHHIDRCTCDLNILGTSFHHITLVLFLRTGIV
jgi:hypothetical protein